MRKQKKDSAMKREAFMSFLETSATNNIEDTKKNNSDQQEVYQEQLTQKSNCCNVCGLQVAEGLAAKRTCGFCDLVACKDHLRKRRRRKNKWQKICDSCQDKFIYDSYMKLQKKKQQSLLVQEQIVTMKYDSTTEIYKNKKQKLDRLLQRQKQIKENNDNQINKLQQISDDIQTAYKAIEYDRTVCQRMREENQRIQKKIKDNYQEDYQILQKQNQKLGKQLGSTQVKCLQVQNAIKKRQKQIEKAYEEWQEKQNQKKILKEKQKSNDCAIF